MTNYCNKCRELNELLNEILAYLGAQDVMNWCELHRVTNEWIEKQNKINGE